MQVEVFEGTTKLREGEASEFDEIETQLTLQDLKARIEICQKLGLTAQARPLIDWYMAYYLRYTVPIPYPFISKEQEEMMCAAFPTRHKKNLTQRDSHAGCRALKDYRYDFIPLGALEVWNQCVEQRVFGSYEIWTPERQQPDPLLIGRRREHPFIYIISRWGDALRPWEELLAEESQRRW